MNGNVPLFFPTKNGTLFNGSAEVDCLEKEWRVAEEEVKRLKGGKKFLEEEVNRLKEGWRVAEEELQKRK